MEKSLSKQSKQATTGFNTNPVLQQECQETHFRSIDEIYTTYFGILVESALKMAGGNRHQAEDLVSTVFERVLNYKPDIIALTKKGVLFYLKECLFNVFVSHYQKKLRRERLSVNIQIKDSVLPYEYDPNEILTTLPKLQRECLRIHQEGFTYEEIAEILGINHNKVKNSIYYARKSLKELNLM